MTTHGAPTPLGHQPSRIGVVRNGWRLPVTVTTLAAGAVGVIWLTPGGLGDPDPVRVTQGVSASTYESLAGRLVGLPTWTHTIIETAASAGLLVLAALLLITVAPRRRDPAALAAAILTCCATVVAYVTSEALKVVVDEHRPCRVLGDNLQVTDCPPLGDWSFPSNHATLAAAMAVGVVFVQARIGVIALLVGVAVGALRVLAGMHYPHDVLAGMLLGGALAVAVQVTLIPVSTALVSRLGSRRQDQPGVR
jgi:membrane-associated phospholipid phosphatase